MSVAARCSACHRELLLDQLTQPWAGFRCPFCGQAFAPSYATVAPGVAARALAAHGELVAALTELISMTGGRLQLDTKALIEPIAGALPDDIGSRS